MAPPPPRYLGPFGRNDEGPDAVHGAAVVLAFATALIASVLWVRRPPE